MILVNTCEGRKHSLEESSIMTKEQYANGFDIKRRCSRDGEGKVIEI